MQLVYRPISVYLCSVIISVFTYYLHEFTIYYCIYLLFVYVLSGHKSSALHYLNYLHGSTKITCIVLPKSRSTPEPTPKLCLCIPTDRLYQFV